MSDHDSVELFQDICSRCGKLFALKNSQYGDAIWKTGVLGATVELIGAVARLPQLVLKSSSHGSNVRETLKDIFADIHNYANIALMMLEADNWEGED